MLVAAAMGTTETQVSNMSHIQATLINQMAAKPEVVSSLEEEDRIKSLPNGGFQEIPIYCCV